MMNNQRMDSERARAAFEELRQELDQLNELRRATVDVEKAAAHAEVIGRVVQQPEIHELFAKLPPEVFDVRHVDNLEKAALATLHAVVEHRDAAVHASQARVPADTIKQATELKQEMLRVLKYNLRDEASIAIIADIETGNSHADSASDLFRLAKQYELNHERLAQDRVYYRRDDAAKAREIAHRIYACLGGDTESNERTWAAYVQRAWTFLLNTYDEVSAAGRWMYRHENGEERFPSLIAAQRQIPKRNGRNETTSDTASDTASEAQAEAQAEILALPDPTPAATPELA